MGDSDLSMGVQRACIKKRHCFTGVGDRPGGRTGCIAAFLLWVLVSVFTPAVPGAWAVNVEVTALDGHTIEFYQGCRALVVGVEHYDHWPVRPHAVREARDVAWELERLGFTVRLVTDPTAGEFRTALSEWARASGEQPQGGLVFYYAGNSQARLAADGIMAGWLIPKDAPLPSRDQQGFEDRAVSPARFLELADQVQSRHALFFIDAPFPTDHFRVETPVLRIIRDEDASPARQFITSGAHEGPGPERNAFGRYLLLGLKGEADLIQDGAISASELGLYLSDRVSRVTGRQNRPQFGRIPTPAENSGEFVFKVSRQALTFGRLFVDAQPASADIRIMNIKPRFEQGMSLQPGTYQLRVSAGGHETVDQTVRLEAGESRTVAIHLPEQRDQIENSLGMLFRRIRPGSFTMGSPANEPGRLNDETRHRVNLTRSYFIQNTEVTAGQFKQFVQAAAYATEAEKGGGCWIASGGAGWKQKPGTSWKNPGSLDSGDALPVVCVTWNDARAFALWLSRKEGRTYRLPTEAEWEYAARAGTSTPFSTGRCLSTDEANYGRLGPRYQLCVTVFKQRRDQLVKAGTLSPNPWKLHNIHGNVSEWCLDWYGPYPSGSQTNPTGPASGSEHVMRGGHWQADAAGCRSARRWRFPSNLASDVVGFRLVVVP
jgi:formylglycine-generating enzyme required for sulfatase activity